MSLILEANAGRSGAFRDLSAACGHSGRRGDGPVFDQSSITRLPASVILMRPTNAYQS
jgi:hypothetical protein